MKHKGWIIYTQEDYQKNAEYAQRYIHKGMERALEIQLVFRENIQYGIKGGNLWVEANQIQGLPDFIINRTLDSLLARHLELMGIKVFNSAEISIICNDKARTYQEAVKLGLPVLDTCFTTRSELMNPAKRSSSSSFSLDYPVIVKSVGGRGGAEVYRADCFDEVLKSVSLMQADRFVIQKMCSAPGRDVRVFVIGKQIIGAIERISQGDFKANYKLGGTAQLYRLNEKEISLVMKLINRFDIGFAGIDFIFDDEGNFIFNEMEDVVGSRTLCIYGDVDVVGLYLDHISTIL